MLISIAMASYNGEKYIREQIDSILNQTYQDFELIVCDDCSTDLTWDILQEYESTDTRIHGYLNEENLGFKKNFEKAISLCKGEYIALSDQDDIWTSDHLEVLLQNIGNNMLCCGDAALIDACGKDMGLKLSDSYGELGLLTLDSNEKKIIRILYNFDPYQGASMLLRREKIKFFLPIPEDILYHDAWFAFCACTHGSLIYINRAITNYRQHERNASGFHGEKSIWNSIKHTVEVTFFRKVFSDRPAYCAAILERFPDIDETKRDIIVSAKKYFIHQFNFFYRIKILPFWIRNFQYIYLTKSKKIFCMRLIKFLFLK